MTFFTGQLHPPRGGCALEQARIPMTAAATPTQTHSDASRARLSDIIFKSSFGRGEITLASGRKSDFYFDLKPTIFNAEGGSLIAALLLPEVLRAGGEYVGGLELGAVPLASLVSFQSIVAGTPVDGFFVRKQAKGHGARKLVEGLANGESLAGKRVVILEDVTTTGDSAFKAVEACQEVGANVVLVVSIVDRQEGASEAFAARKLPFKALFTAADFLSRK
jgi:orotate phosphoribosyltransferase